MYEELIKGKKLNTEKLLAYGFKKEGGHYRYTLAIMSGEFRLTVDVDEKGSLDTNLKESETGENYVLYKTHAVGEYIGAVRSAVNERLQAIVDACYDASVFRFPQTLRLIDYVTHRYGDALEYLWPKTPDCAIWRRKDNARWYGVIMTIDRFKITGDGQEKVEIIDLKVDRNKMEELLAQPAVYPGWHMNKKHWITIILDDSLSDEALIRYLDRSYELAQR